MKRLGWALMGYPYKIGYRKWIFNTPFWQTVYRLGAWLHNVRDRP